MPDITMCKGVDCLRKAECYRCRAIPTPQRQAYFASPPVRANGSCDSFLELRKGDRLSNPHTNPKDAG